MVLYRHDGNNSSKASTIRWADTRVPEPSSIAGEEHRWAATVKEHVAPLHLENLLLVKDPAFGPFSSDQGM